MARSVSYWKKYRLIIPPKQNPYQTVTFSGFIWCWNTSCEMVATHGFNISEYEGEFGIAVGRAATTCEENNKNGYICSADCKTLMLCYKSGDGWKDISTPCEGDNFCNTKTAKCDNAAGHCKTKENAKIYCTAAGIFPDPDDCQRYHACESNKTKSVPIDCPAGTHFDPNTRQCAVGTCIQTPIVCSSIGQTGAFSDGSTYYYICGADGAIIFACEPGFIYSEGKCINGTVTTTPAPPTVTCGTHGENVRDPANCYNYYSCRNSLNPVLKSCPPGQYFDRRYRECRRGRCPY